MSVNVADSLPPRMAFAIGALISLGMCVSLYLTFTEPSTVTRVVFAGRVLCQLGVVGLGVSTALGRRGRGWPLVIAMIVGVTGLLLIAGGWATGAAGAR